MLKGNKYGIHRVIEPQGVLTQAAKKIDNDMTKRYSNEIICDVISLNNLGHKKVKKILIDEKISKWDRNKIPVLEMEYRKNNKIVTEILSVGDIKFSKYLRKKEVKDKTQNEEMLLIIGRKNGR